MSLPTWPRPLPLPTAHLFLIGSLSAARRAGRDFKRDLLRRQAVTWSRHSLNDSQQHLSRVLRLFLRTMPPKLTVELDRLVYPIFFDVQGTRIEELNGSSRINPYNIFTIITSSFCIACPYSGQRREFRTALRGGTSRWDYRILARQGGRCNVCRSRACRQRPRLPWLP